MSPQARDTLDSAKVLLDLLDNDYRVLRNAVWAASNTADGHYFATKQLVPSVNKLANRGYLTIAEQQNDLGKGVRYSISPAGWRKLIDDSNDILTLTRSGHRPTYRRKNARRTP
jgi:hypothetical protein